MRHWQLVAGGLWALLGLGVLTRNLWMTADAMDRLPVRNWTTAWVVCFLLAVWNWARWYQRAQSRRTTTGHRLAPNPEARSGYEYHPEFDFQKSPTDTPPPKS